MARPEERISEVAREIARQSQARAHNLSTELREAEQRVAEVKTKLDAANFAFKRLADFQIKSGRDYQCPRCWIDNKTRTGMQPRAAPDPNVGDLLECPVCGLEIDIPFDD